MDVATGAPYVPETWTSISNVIRGNDQYLQDRVGSAVQTSYTVLDPDTKQRFRMLGVLAEGVVASDTMVRHLWNTVGRRLNFLREY